MPTKHPRHIVTETGEIADAFARARRVDPDVHIRDLVIAGADAIAKRGQMVEVDEERRAAAIERLIAMTTTGDGIDHDAAMWLEEHGSTPELRDE